MNKPAKITPPCKPKIQEKCKRNRIGQCIECGGSGKKKQADKNK